MRSRSLLRLTYSVVGLIFLTACGGGGGSSGGSSGGGGGGVVTVPNTAPVITSSFVSTVYSGNSGAAYAIVATDAQNDPLTYGLSGNDAARFSVSTNGEVRFVTPPQYTTPSDSDSDNAYQVTISVSDSKKTVTQDISILVTEPSTASYNWTDLPWGGGSVVSGVIYHPKVKGLLYARTPIGGAFKWDDARQVWTSLLDSLSAAEVNLLSVQSIALDPNNADRLYLAVGANQFSNGFILRSADGGNTWQRTQLPVYVLGAGFNGMGERLVVDPNKTNVLYYASATGVYKSVDYGAHWSKLSASPVTGANFIVIDPSSGGSGSASDTFYVGMYLGLYKVTNEGSTWTPVRFPGGALSPVQGVFAGRNLYMTFTDYETGYSHAGAVLKLNTQTGVWTDISPVSAPLGTRDGGYHGLAVDPQDPNIILATRLGSSGALIYRSVDAGQNWAELTATGTFTSTASPWVTAKGDGFIGGNLFDIEIDPFNSGVAVYTSEIGVYKTKTLKASRTNWETSNQGMNLQRSLNIVSPRTGPFALAMNQAGISRHTDVSPKATYTFTAPDFHPTTSVDYAENNPGIMVRSTRYGIGMTSFISHNGGATWTQLAAVYGGSPSDPDKASQESIAVSPRASQMAWLLEDGSVRYSNDSGLTWSASNGVPTNAVLRSLISDRAVESVFYALDITNGALLESVDGGQTFRSVHTGLVLDNRSQLIALPGKRRDLWLATKAGLFHFETATGPAVRISAATEAYSIGYGAPAPRMTSPSLYLYGKVSGITGIFRSDDNGRNWTRINDDAHQFGTITHLAGDPRAWGRVYLVTERRGIIVGNRF